MGNRSVRGSNLLGQAHATALHKKGAAAHPDVPPQIETKPMSLLAARRPHLVPPFAASRQTFFRKVAMYAIKRAGKGYERAYRTSLRSNRFFEDIPPENIVLAELTDSLDEMPAIAHLAVRGALADPRQEVVSAAETLLSRHPELHDDLEATNDHVGHDIDV